MDTLGVSTYYPLSYLPIYPYNTTNLTFDPEYINDLISLGVTDYFSPTQFATNPLFATTDTFNQNVGILQTAVDGLSNILTLVDDLKNINEPTEDVIKEFSDEINNIISNTTFDNLNVFDQTLNIDGQNVDLSIPTFDPNTTNIEDYYKLLEDKYNSLTDLLQNISFTLPFENSFNPTEFSTYYDLLNSSTLYNAYDLSNLTPQTLELLLT
jgi:hypothetical protein